jgi:hypothetical protein
MGILDFCALASWWRRRCTPPNPVSRYPVLAARWPGGELEGEHRWDKTRGKHQQEVLVALLRADSARLFAAMRMRAAFCRNERGLLYGFRWVITRDFRNRSALPTIPSFHFLEPQLGHWRGPVSESANHSSLQTSQCQ